MFLIPHLGTIIWVTIIFSLLLFVLSKFAWKPLLKALNDREQSIKDALDSAIEAQLQLAAIQTTQEEMINISKQKREQIIKEGFEQQEKIIALAKEKATIDAAKIIEDARKRIAIEREMAFETIKNQIASLSVDIATKVVRADLEDKKRHEKLVQELIKEIDIN